MGKILIVDDEETIRYAFGSFLADEGHTVVTAGSYEEALAEMAGSAFDLYFAGHHPGGPDGDRDPAPGEERSPASPVVMITGYPTLDTASEAIQQGAFDYVPKPIRQRTLLEVTGSALKHKALVDEKERSAPISKHLPKRQGRHRDGGRPTGRDGGERSRPGDLRGFAGCHRQPVRPFPAPVRGEIPRDPPGGPQRGEGRRDASPRMPGGRRSEAGGVGRRVPSSERAGGDRRRRSGREGRDPPGLPRAGPGGAPGVPQPHREKSRRCNRSTP